MDDRIVYGIGETGTWQTGSPTPHVTLDGGVPSGVSIVKRFDEALSSGEVVTVTVRIDADNWSCYGYESGNTGTVGPEFTSGNPDILDFSAAHLLASKGMLSPGDPVEVWAELPEPDYAQPSYDTAQSLRDAGVPSNPTWTVVTIGAITRGDGGGGNWYWDAASTADDNLGTVLNPTGNAGDGRWLREKSIASEIHATWFGLIATPSAAIQAAIDTIGDWQDGGDVSWKYNTQTVVIPDGLNLDLTDKIKIHPRTQCVIKCPSPAGTILNYTGAGFVAFEYQPGSRWHIFGMENLAIQSGDVATVGSNSGLPLFKRVHLYNSPNFGLWFVDGNDYYDGDEYPTPPYTGPVANTAASGLLNTTFFQADEIVSYKSQGNAIRVEATTYLLGRIRKARIYESTNASMVLDCVGVLVEDCDFTYIATANTTTQPYIHCPCEKENFRYNKLIGIRFGHEAASATGGPPTRLMVFGPLTGTSLPPNVADYNTIRDCEFLGGDPYPITESGIYISATARQNKINNCRFSNLQNAAIEFADHAEASSTTNWYGADNQLISSNPPPVITNDFESVIDQRKQVHRGPVPTIDVQPASGVGASATITGTDVSGRIVITVGTSQTNGSQARVTFAEPYSITPNVMVVSATSEGAKRNLYVDRIRVDTFDISVADALINNLTVEYFVAEAGQ